MRLLNRKNCLLILLLAHCAVYLQAVGFPWIQLDDYQHIFENPLMITPSWQNLWSFWKAPFFTLYIPFTYTSWFSLALVTLDPWIFHLANVFLHGVNALLVFLLFAEIFEDDALALGGALLFALHPIQAESVTWVSGLKDCLFGFFYLLASYLYVLRIRLKKQPPNYVFLILFLLSYLSKPMAITLPLVLFAFRRYFLKETWKESVYALWAVFVLILPFAIIAKNVQPDLNVQDLAPLWARPLIALHSLGFYLKQVAFPAQFQLDYGRKPSWVMDHWAEEAYLIVPIALLAYGLYHFRKERLFLLGVALLILPLLPVIGVVPFQFQLFSTVADRYFYLSLVGAAILFVLFLKSLPKNLLPIPSLALILLGALCFFQVNQWRSNEAIFEQTLARNPRSFLAHNNLAYIYFQEHQYQRAAEHLDVARKLHPHELGLSMNYTAALVKSGRTQEAIHVLEEVLRKEPNHSQAQKALKQLQPKG